MNLEAKYTLAAFQGVACFLRKVEQGVGSPMLGELREAVSGVSI